MIAKITISLAILLAIFSGAAHGAQCAMDCNPLSIVEPYSAKAGTNIGQAVTGILRGMTEIMRAKGKFGEGVADWGYIGVGLLTGCCGSATCGNPCIC